MRGGARRGSPRPGRSRREVHVRLVECGRHLRVGERRLGGGPALLQVAEPAAQVDEVVTVQQGRPSRPQPPRTRWPATTLGWTTGPYAGLRGLRLRGQGVADLHRPRAEPAGAPARPPRPRRQRRDRAGGAPSSSSARATACWSTRSCTSAAVPAAVAAVRSSSSTATTATCRTVCASPAAPSTSPSSRARPTSAPTGTGRAPDRRPARRGRRRPPAGWRAGADEVRGPRGDELLRRRQLGLQAGGRLPPRLPLGLRALTAAADVGIAPGARRRRVVAGTADRARLTVGQPPGQLGGHAVDPGLLRGEERLPRVLLGLAHPQDVGPQRGAAGPGRRPVGGEAVHLGPASASAAAAVRAAVAACPARTSASARSTVASARVRAARLLRRGRCEPPSPSSTSSPQPDPVRRQPPLDRRHLLEGHAVLVEGREPSGGRDAGSSRRPRTGPAAPAPRVPEPRPRPPAPAPGRAPGGRPRPPPRGSPAPPWRQRRPPLRVRLERRHGCRAPRALGAAGRPPPSPRTAPAWAAAAWLSASPDAARHDTACRPSRSWTSSTSAGSDSGRDRTPLDPVTQHLAGTPPSTSSARARSVASRCSSSTRAAASSRRRSTSQVSTPA